MSCSSARGQADADQQTAFQDRFEIGAAFLLSGDYRAAATLFEELYRDTQSDRVKLEWARALYLLGEYERSAALFREVLANDPPLAVQNNIDSFLEDIRLRRLKVDFAVGIVSDTNPRDITDARSFDLFGYSFTLTPEFDTSVQYGLSYQLTLSKAFADGRYVVNGMVSGAEFGESDFDSQTIAGALTYYILLRPRLYLRPGFEWGRLGNRDLYTAPYVSAGGIIENVFSSDYILADFRLGRIDYPDFPYIRSLYQSASASYFRYLSENFLSGVEIAIAENNARESAYSFTSYGVALSSVWEPQRLNVQVQLGVRNSQRQFHGADVFFGLKRRDDLLAAHAGLQLKVIEVLGFSPTLELTWNQVNSNLALYSFSRTRVGVGFRRSY
jgi:outer membrane protein